MRTIGAITLLPLVLSAACAEPTALGRNGEPIFRQKAISDIACGPSSLFNWMSHGGDDLAAILKTLSAERSSVETVEFLIDRYGKKRSATNPAVVRYGRHNGGVGSVNLLLMARELVADHLAEPPHLRGEYLHRFSDESERDHLQRVVQWYTTSIEAGVPVIQYMRRYQRTAQSRRPALVFGHHVVVTSVGAVTAVDGRLSAPFVFVDSASGAVDRGELAVASEVFTAPTFTYRLEAGRAFTTEAVVRGKPLLELHVPSYESGTSARREIMVAHFATFAAGPEPDRR